ncbi:MAG: alpha/beta fold hydrolase [Candidatus Thorarchaeota archaeon]
MSVHFEEAGRGNSPSLVMVHGAGGSSATWFMQLRGLARSFHIVAIDLNGHGRTPDRNPDDVTASYLEDIASVVEGLHEPVLAGHSMGGALAQLYALERPDRISGLILISTGARLRVAQFIFDLLDNDFDGYVEAVGKYMFAEGASRELISASKAEVRKCPPDIIRRDFVVCNEFDIMDQVKNIRVPTLVIVGSEDVMTPVKYAAYLDGQIPASSLKIIDGAGHSVMLERPQEVNEAMIEWIDSSVR